MNRCLTLEAVKNVEQKHLVRIGMEDSGIDSGDHNGDIRDQQDKNALFIRPANSDTSSSAGSGGRSPSRTYVPSVTTPSRIISPPSVLPTSRQLQRKLEARIESARRLHRQQQLLETSSGGKRRSTATTECVIQPMGPSLLPLQRLNIPRAMGGSSQPTSLAASCTDQQQRPLVQWEDSDDSEEDIINFFPLSRKESKSHQEISDTFSIEELSISGDEDEEEDLHLVPPSTIYRTVTCCPAFSCSLL